MESDVSVIKFANNIQTSSTIIIQNNRIVTFYSPLEPSHLIADGSFDVIRIESGGTLALKYVDITRQSGTEGRGIYNLGILHIYDSVIKGHVNNNTAALGWGSGIHNAHGSNLIMWNGNIFNNTVAGVGGGVYISPSSNFIMNGGRISNNVAEGNGGGVFNRGSFTMNNGSIYSNRSENSGGGVFNDGGKFTMNSGSISHNTANNWGGGVRNHSIENGAVGIFLMHYGIISDNIVMTYSGGGVDNRGNFYMYGGTVSNNVAVGAGGVDNRAKFNMVGGEITGNIAKENAGGVRNRAGGTFNLYRGIITSNLANEHIGGVSNLGYFFMDGGEILYNTAIGNVGGVGNSASGEFTLLNGYISQNTAVRAGGVLNLGMFTMRGGTISHNEATDTAGGVENRNEAYFTMYLGYIKHNVAEWGGGVSNIGSFLLCEEA